jgi:hypothetical protein
VAYLINRQFGTVRSPSRSRLPMDIPEGLIGRTILIEATATEEDEQWLTV